MRVTILDYGVGNLHSITKALVRAGAMVRVEVDPRGAADSEALVLPGVGAFGPAAARLAPARDHLRASILAGLPTLGICLGMQLLFDASEEGDGDGLGIFSGRVARLRAARLPQIGWNDVEATGEPLFAASGFRTAYYANSFACRAHDARDVIAWSTHEEDRFVAAVRRGNCVGLQFHPEKSSTPGIRLLEAWLHECAGAPKPTSPRQSANP
jgi:glutamine amidotransferase